MAETVQSTLRTMSERIGVLAGKADAAHSRLDKTEVEIALTLKEINAEMKVIVAWMNSTKGSVKTMIAMAGLLGAVLGFVIKLLIK